MRCSRSESLGESLLDRLALHQWGADEIAQSGGDHGAPALGSAFRVDVQLQGLGLELDGPEDDGAVAHGRRVAERLALSPRALLRHGALRRQPVPEGRRGWIEIRRLIEGCSNPLLRHTVLQPVDEHDELHRLAVAVGQLRELGIQDAVEQVDQKE